MVLIVLLTVCSPWVLGGRTSRSGTRMAGRDRCPDASLWEALVICALVHATGWRRLRRSPRL